MWENPKRKEAIREDNGALVDLFMERIFCQERMRSSSLAFVQYTSLNLSRKNYSALNDPLIAKLKISLVS